jgi:thiamine pyrophosphate-dependent acetolactate synthase large subunit-like protein
MSAQHRKPALDRRKAAAAILVRRADALVVTGLGAPTWDTAAAGDSPLNFYTWGGMGCAAMVGLGLALAQPKRRVIVITGDGEMLMALGALATIAVLRPRNLSIVVMDNEHYGETGMQPTHTGLGTDMAGMAKAAGFHATQTVYTTAELKTWIPKIYAAGPVFVDIKVTTERAPLVLPPRDGTLLKLRFRDALLGEA